MNKKIKGKNTLSLIDHFAVVDERLSKNKKMKYHRDGIGYIYSQDIDNNFIEIINRKS